MLKRIFIALFLMLSGMLQGQDALERIWQEVDSVYLKSEAEKSSFVPVKRWNLNASLGSSFMYVPDYGTFLTTFVAPHLNYNAGSRLSFQGGVIVSNVYMPFYAEGQEQATAGSQVFSSVFLQGTYQVGENFYLHASGVKGLADPYYIMNGSASDFQDIAVGATYKIGNFSIGASFHRSNGSAFSSPYGNFGRSSMFGYPSFY